MHNPVPDSISTSAQKTDSPEGLDWPYSAPKLTTPIPLTLPGGKPWPKISVITASYNQGKYIEETILSVANQNYPNLEHIIIDGGSTDETVSILKKYQHLFSYWVSEKDRGQCHAINKGFNRANGEIVTWLNSDDMFTPGALAAVALAFHLSDADMVAGVCQLHRGGVIIEQHLTSCDDGPLPLSDMLDLDHGWKAGQFFHQPEVFFKRDLWLKAGGALDENIYINLDYELWLRFAKAGANLKVIGRPTALFRVHEEQKTHDTARFLKEIQAVRDQFVAQNPDVVLNEPSTCKKTNKLRVLLFNDVGFRYGAGIAHERIATALLLAGHEVRSLAINGRGLSEHFKFAPFNEEIFPAVAAINPDVVIIGNLHSASVDPKHLTQIVAQYPTIFVLHDKWLLTGRCAYSGDCKQNITVCDSTCPTSNEYPRLPLSRIKPTYQAKRALITTPSKLVLAANSKWMQREIHQLAEDWSATPEAPCRNSFKIRFGIPLDIFRPQDKDLCRELLGLPKNKFIIFFSSSRLTERRKGGTHLIEAIRLAAIPDLLPVSVGHYDPKVDGNIPEIKSMGYITDPHRLALLYSAADLFVGPSLEEAFGQVYMEAAACGTPSIGYAVGGVPEAIIEGVTGHLASPMNPEALSKAITNLYINPSLRRQMAAWGRIYVENEYSATSSYHSLSFALRKATAGTKTPLAKKIALRTTPFELPATRYLIGSPSNEAAVSIQLALKRWYYTSQSKNLRHPPRQPRLEQAIMQYCDEELKRICQKTSFWFLMPKVWLLTINRRHLIKVTADDDFVPDPVDYMITEPNLNASMAKYYREQLAFLRQGRIPWIFSPQAWMLKLSRNIFNHARNKSTSTA